MVVQACNPSYSGSRDFIYGYKPNPLYTPSFPLVPALLPLVYTLGKDFIFPSCPSFLKN
jgi:hypothetical protein